MAEPDTAPGGTESPATKTEADPPATATDPNEPGYLKGRLDQAKRSGERGALERLGLADADIESAKKLIAEAKALEQSKKSAETRAAEAEERAKSALTRTQQLETTNKEHAARMMAVLTDEQRKEVEDLAGEDPLLQLRAIHTCGPRWAAHSQALKEAEQARVAKEKADKAPATTAPAPNAPGGTDPQSPPDHRAVYESLKTNPFARAAYGAAHPEAYQPRK